jgi:DNA-binding transcriptional ArsR family regulator
MPVVRVVRDPRHAALLAAPVRQRILAALAAPGSASTVAKALGLGRQAVAYHVRRLEEHGFLKLVREEQRRGCTERIVQRSARYLIASNAVLGRSGLDPRRVKDRFSSEYLMALAEQMSREVADAQTAAERAGNPLATLSTDVEVRLRSPQERQAFAEELVESIARLAAKYHDETHPDGRRYRLVVGAYPIRTPRRTT